jgi:hypothetical protein
VSLGTNRGWEGEGNIGRRGGGEPKIAWLPNVKMEGEVPAGWDDYGAPKAQPILGNPLANSAARIDTLLPMRKGKEEEVPVGWHWDWDGGGACPP